jgi:hypothetical protein
MTVGDPASPTAGGMVATAMRVVNAVPYVVAAPSGLLSSLDLPLTLPRAAFEPQTANATATATLTAGGAVARRNP